MKRIRRLLNIAVEQGWISVNPFEKGGSLVVDSFEVERTRTLSRDEESRLLSACTGERTKPIERKRLGKIEKFEQTVRMENPQLRAEIILAI